MINVKSLLLVMAILLLSACGGESNSESKKEVTTELGSLHLSLGQGATTRTITSTFDMNIARFDVEGTGPQGASFSISGSDASVLVGQLAAGDWTISVNAYNAVDDVIASGSTSVVVVAQETVSATITVEPFSGTGTLELTVTWPVADVASPALVMTLVDNQDAQISLSPVIDAGAGSATVTVSLGSGYYSLIIQLSNGDALVIGHTDVVRILKDQTTSGSIIFDTVNSVDGAMALTIEQRMAMPINLQLSGLSDTVVNTRTIELTATAPLETQTLRYDWYKNGELLQADTTNTYSYTPGEFEAGISNFSVIAQTQDRSRAGSINEQITIVGADVALSETVAPSSHANAALADFNGDGFMDVLGGIGSLSSTDKILLNDGDGTFTDTLAELTGYQTLDVAAGDMDGDGDADAVIASTAGLFIKLNDGAGNFTDVQEAVVPRYVSLVEVADLDADDDMDLVIRNADQPPSLDIYLNNGAGGFVQGFSDGRDMGIQDMDVADLDSDGDLDILLTLTAYAEVKGSRILLNDGTGGFEESANLVGGEENGVKSVVADFNGDGHVDIMVSRSDLVVLYTGDGGGRYLISNTVARVEQPRNLSPVDVNGDGRLDVLIGRYGSPTRQGLLYINIGDGNFVDSKLEISSVYSREVLSHDFDLDGDEDFIFSTSSGLDVYQNNLINQ